MRKRELEEEQNAKQTNTHKKEIEIENLYMRHSSKVRQVVENSEILKQ